MKFKFKIFLLLGMLLLTGYGTRAQFILPENFNKPKAEANTGQKDANDVQGDVFINIKPGARNGVFKNADDIIYNLKVTNNYTVSQQGVLTCFVTTDENQPVYLDSVKVNMGKNSINHYRFKINASQPGFYKIGFAFHLTYYDDTVKRVFGLKPLLLTTETRKPADFDSFWQSTLDTLKTVNPQYKVTLQPALSVNNKKVYLVEMHSWGNAVIRGWLSIPNERDKKIAVKYRLPGYVVKAEHSVDDDDFAVFNINVRGNGNSADAIDTHGEYNLYNLENRDTYVYRSVYMDCVRGLDFLASHADMGLDTAKIMVDGASQGGTLVIALAALDKRVKIVTCEVPLYADFRKALEITKLDPKSQTPVGMIAKYQRTHPNFTNEKLFKVWDYYDPLNFAPMVKCPVLMGIGLLDQFCPPRCSFVLYNQLKNKNNEIWASPDKTHEVDGLYYTYQYLWFQDLLRLP
ncbi:acetylxylan esterase [Mucilaginibacter gracilis]|uniref:acetylxylan esterase n=1 Tax=Mucilaginibacter gracilis TaxID=423350 RepID=UPI0013C35521|nr:acetylxylan esterase [Mucilaginibacter gracilis]